MGRWLMKKIFISIFIIFISITFSNAEEVKKDKKYENMSEEQLMAEFMKLDKKTKKEEIELEKEKKIGKTLIEIKDKIGVDKK